MSWKLDSFVCHIMLKLTFCLYVTEAGQHLELDGKKKNQAMDLWIIKIRMILSLYTGCDHWWKVHEERGGTKYCVLP